MIARREVRREVIERARYAIEAVDHDERGSAWIPPVDAWRQGCRPSTITKRSTGPDGGAGERSWAAAPDEVATARTRVGYTAT